MSHHNDKGRAAFEYFLGKRDQRITWGMLYCETTDVILAEFDRQENIYSNKLREPNGAMQSIMQQLSEENARVEQDFLQKQAEHATISHTVSEARTYETEPMMLREQLFLAEFEMTQSQEYYDFLRNMILLMEDYYRGEL